MERMQLSQDQLAARDILARLSGGSHPPELIEGRMSLLHDLGIESLQFIRLVLEVEEAIGRKVFDVETLSKISTVADLYNLLAASAVAQS
jgi:acyl carrier protein